MKQPKRIQRYLLQNQVFYPCDIANTNFEAGRLEDSINRMRKTGLATSLIELPVNKSLIVVYLVANADFNFQTYAEFLPLFINDDLSLEEPTYFNDNVNRKLGFHCENHAVTNAWLDIDNDVIWTITDKDFDELLTSSKPTN